MFRGIQRIGNAILACGGAQRKTTLHWSRNFRLSSIMKQTIESSSTGLTSMQLQVKGEQLELNYHWLRDYCRCDACYNSRTSQKNQQPHNIQDGICPRETKISGDSLNLTWPDGHISSYKLDWLLDNHFFRARASAAKVQVLWDGDSIKTEKYNFVEYDKYMNSEEGLKEHLQNLLTYGFSVVQGVTSSIEDTQKVSERLCHIQTTMFGSMWQFTSDFARDDTAYTTMALGAHTDATYLSIPCGIQVFHCLHHDGEGGKTLLVDGFNAAMSLKQSSPEAFDILSRIKVEHEYIEKGPNPHHTLSLESILRTHPVSGELEWIRYNHYDRAPLRTVPPDQLPAYYSALGSLSANIENPSNEHWIKLKPGMVLFVDNWRVLHGRSSFTGKRHVCGCYLPRDDWVGKARTLGLV